MGKGTIVSLTIHIGDGILRALGVARGFHHLNLLSQTHTQKMPMYEGLHQNINLISEVLYVTALK